MTYIRTDIPQPGIVELLFYKGPTGKALSRLAHTLLHGPSPLSKGERELIAGYVSRLNGCEFCSDSHCASANAHFGDDGKTTAYVKSDIMQAPVTDKMKALLKLAARVQAGGREVQPEHIEAAKTAGASDEEIHDTVLIAAAFCMYNRYVDGLRTNLPESEEEYVEMGKRMAGTGYKYPPLFLRKWVIRSFRKKANRSN
jgi:uncharacterized peroxidase-related enzyme